MKTLIITFLVISLFAFSAKAQTATWTGWTQVYPENGYTSTHKVEISFEQNPNCLGYSHYRTRSDFNVENGNVSFYFDYLDCDGKMQSESITVLLDTPKVDYSATGTWYIGAKIVTPCRNVVPFIPQPSSANIGSTSSGINGSSLGQSTVDTAANNRNQANLLKPDLNLVINTFNSTYLTAYQKLPIIHNILAEKAYAAKLDSCKAQFNIYYQQAVFNYKNGNGNGLGTNLTSLKSILSTMQTYLSMEGDVRLVYNNANKGDTSLLNKNAINNQSSQGVASQNNANQPSNNNADAITQATQLGIAEMNLKYSSTHGASSAVISQQQQQQVNQMQQQQNVQNAANISNAVSGLESAIGALINNNSDKKVEENEQATQIEYTYNQAYGNLDNQIQQFVINNSSSKLAFYKAGTTYEEVAVKFLNIMSNKIQDGKGYFAEPVIQLRNICNNNFIKASEMFKNALKIDSNYFDANLEIAIVIMLPAINQIEINKDYGGKEHRDEIKTGKAQLEIAKNYAQKAFFLNPKSKYALSYLILYYQQIDDKKKVKELQKEIDALKN